jgi:hypothetical protein
LAKKQALVTRGLSKPARTCRKNLAATFDFQLETLVRFRQTYGHVCPAATCVFPLEHADPAAGDMSKRAEPSQPPSTHQALGEWCTGVRCLEKFGTATCAHWCHIAGALRPRPRVSFPCVYALCPYVLTRMFASGLLPEEYKSRLHTIGFDFNSSSAYAKRLEAERAFAAAHAQINKSLTCQLCSEGEVLLLAEGRGELVLASLAQDDAACASPGQLVLVPADASVMQSGGASRDDGLNRCACGQGTPPAGAGEGEGEEGAGAISKQLPAYGPAGDSGSSTPAVPGSSASLRGAGDFEEGGLSRCNRSQ